jgi:hypothetical protein
VIVRNQKGRCLGLYTTPEHKSTSTGQPLATQDSPVIPNSKAEVDTQTVYKPAFLPLPEELHTSFPSDRELKWTREKDHEDLKTDVSFRS